MKLLQYILAVYLVLLSAVPCCAFDQCPDDQAPTGQTREHKSGDADDCGSCSPFFNCEGCASVTIDIPDITFTPFTPLVKRVYAGFIPSRIPAVHYDFWQPPRLS